MQIGLAKKRKKETLGKSARKERTKAGTRNRINRTIGGIGSAGEGEEDFAEVELQNNINIHKKRFWTGRLTVRYDAAHAHTTTTRASFERSCILISSLFLELVNTHTSQSK